MCVCVCSSSKVKNHFYYHFWELLSKGKFDAGKSNPTTVRLETPLVDRGTNGNRVFWEVPSAVRRVILNKLVCLCVVVSRQRSGCRKSDLIYSSSWNIWGKRKEIKMMGVLPFAQAWSKGLGDLPSSVTETQKYVCHHAWGVFRPEERFLGHHIPTTRGGWIGTTSRINEMWKYVIPFTVERVIEKKDCFSDRMFMAGQKSLKIYSSHST